MRTTSGETGAFLMTIGLYQRSALSLYLFVLILDEVTSHIQDEIPLMYIVCI